MDLAAGVSEAQEAAGNDWNRVLLVCDACEAGATSERRDVCVDIICECLVPDAGHTIPDDLEGC